LCSYHITFQWHATTSQADEKWTEAVFDKIFQNKPFNQLTMQDFGAAFRRILADINPDPSKRTFAGYIFLHRIRFMRNDGIT
jgi:linoleate 10R-lipoxygenase